MTLKEHLEQALNKTENAEAEFHIRQALQLRIIEEEHPQFTAHRDFPDSNRQ